MNFFRLFLLYFLSIFVNCQKISSIYDENIAVRSVYLAQMTYCENHLSDVQLEEYGTKAIMGYDKKTNSIYVAFRGSSNMHNWMENIQIEQITPYTNQSLAVEKGFYKAYSYIKTILFESLDTLATKYRTNILLITGHSLGSAMSILFAYDLIKTDYELKYVYNFGSPRVGNQAFIEDFNKHVSAFRVVHNNDIVASVPPQAFNYAHISQGICYNEQNSQYIYCGDVSCSLTNCSSTDHLNYLNITMGASGCQI